MFEDGQPQEIFTFQQNIDLPLSLAILIDTSASEERTLPDEKVAARAFLENHAAASKDEAAIVSFTGETTLEQGFTGNVERLRRAIDRVEFIPPSGYIGGGVVVNGTPPISGTNQSLAGSTAIWDAVWATSEELISASAEHTRRAIILLTDGDDTSSRMKMHEAIERAQKADALIYAIGIGDRYTFNVNEGSLQENRRSRPGAEPTFRVTNATFATLLRRFSGTCASSTWWPIPQQQGPRRLISQNRDPGRKPGIAAKPKVELPLRLLRQDHLGRADDPQTRAGSVDQN